MSEPRYRLFRVTLTNGRVLDFGASEKLRFIRHYEYFGWSVEVNYVDELSSGDYLCRGSKLYRVASVAGRDAYPASPKPQVSSR